MKGCFFSRKGVAGHLRFLKAFAPDTRGTTAIEYALIVSGIFLAIIVIFPQVASSVHGLFAAVQTGVGK